MPYNPAGLFSLVASYLAQPGTTIRTEQHNPPLEDIGSALSSVMIRDGRAPMTGPLNMNGFAINNIATGNSASSIATLSQAMPIGAVIDFAGASAPAGWALCYGQAISRTTYATLFSLLSTTYGAGDGSTTFNLPDIRGRGTAGKDDMGGPSASRITASAAGIDGTVLGASGGNQVGTIAQANLPSFNLNVVIPAGQGSHTHIVNSGASSPGTYSGASSGNGYASAQVAGAATLPSMVGTAASGGSGTALSRMQPTIILNKIIRVSFDG